MRGADTMGRVFRRLAARRRRQPLLVAAPNWGMTQKWRHCPAGRAAVSSMPIHPI